jgi:hypothetical protein
VDILPIYEKAFQNFDLFASKTAIKDFATADDSLFFFRSNLRPKSITASNKSRRLLLWEVPRRNQTCPNIPW